MNNIEFTKKEYNKYGAEYHKELLNSKSGFWHKYLEKPAMTSLLKPIVKNKIVLDLGCGSGIYTKKLNSFGAQVKGLDLSKSLIEIAKKENSKINFFVGDAKKTPFDNSQFDIVSSSLMVHYFKKLVPLFKEVSRILKKKGIFVFSITHPINEVITKKDNLFKFTDYFHRRKYGWEMQSGMKVKNYHHTFEDIVNSLNDSGFIIERVLEKKPPLSSKKINLPAYKKAGICPSSLIIKAKKE